MVCVYYTKIKFNFFPYSISSISVAVGIYNISVLSMPSTSLICV